MAVFTKGELAIEKPMDFANVLPLHFLTFIVINFFAPSPSMATCFAKFNITSSNFFSKSFASLEFLLVIGLFLDLLVENTKTISLVEVSPSTLIALKVFSTFFFKIEFKTGWEILASVKIKPSMVPILGKIIPEPFAIPEILTTLPFILKVSNAIFAIVSVVIIV